MILPVAVPRLPFKTQLMPTLSAPGATAAPATVAPAEAALPEPLNDHTVCQRHRGRCRRAARSNRLEGYDRGATGAGFEGAGVGATGAEATGAGFEGTGTGAAIWAEAA